MNNNLEQILNCLREANAEGMIVDTIWMDDDQTLFDFIELCIEEAALTQQQEAEPAGYVYEFVSQFSGTTVWRHDSGEWNGQRPKSSRPYFFHPPKPAAQPVSTGGERKLQHLGDEIHNASCTVVHLNEEIGLHLGRIASELWNWEKTHPPVAQLHWIVERYNELLYHVARKFPNESRHETALRYIKNAESVESYCAAAKEETK